MDWISAHVATSMQLKVDASILQTQRDCLSLADDIQDLTPDQKIKQVFAGGAHDHSFFCVATFEPEEEDGSFLGSLRSAARSLMMPTWRYTVYLNDDRKKQWLTRASLREEFVRSATDIAIITAAMKKK